MFAGYVSPVKNQMQCGSCVAFASMAAVEVCFKKAAGTMFHIVALILMDTTIQNANIGNNNNCTCVLSTEKGLTDVL